MDAASYWVVMNISAKLIVAARLERQVLAGGVTAGVGVVNVTGPLILVVAITNGCVCPRGLSDTYSQNVNTATCWVDVNVAADLLVSAWLELEAAALSTVSGPGTLGVSV